MTDSYNPDQNIINDDQIGMSDNQLCTSNIFMDNANSETIAYLDYSQQITTNEDNKNQK